MAEWELGADKRSVIMMKRRGLTRRRLIGGGALSSIAGPASARKFFASGGSAGTAAPTITSVLINGSATAANFQASTGNASVGLITAPTSDGSHPTITITGNSEGFHPTSGTAGSMTLLAPSGGLSVGPYTDVTITASGAYSNSPQSINPTLTATSSLTFITGTSFGTPTTGAAGGYRGLRIMVGINNIQVTDLGRYVQAGSSQTHTLGIFDVHTSCFGVSGGNSCRSLVGSLVSLVANGAAPGFQYVTLPSPVVLQAGRQYFIVSTELQGGGNDPIYQSSDSSYTTTTDGTLAGECDYSVSSFGPWGFNSSPNTGDGPTNFKYSITSAPASLPGSPFYYLYGRKYQGSDGDDFLVSAVIGPTSGMVTLDGQFRVNNSWFTGSNNSAIYNTMVVQWIVDETLFSPYITGPLNYSAGGSVPYFPWTFNSASGPYALSDGTHVFRLICIDSFSGMATTEPYRLRCGSGALLIANSGPLTDHYAQARMPVFNNSVNSQRMYAGTADFVNYSGDPQRAVNVFPYPEPNVAPSYRSVIGRVINKYQEHFMAKRYQEYETEPCFASTPNGGIYCNQYHSTGGLTADQALGFGRANFNWDGGRYDNRTSPLTTAIFSPDVTGSYQGYIGVEIQGRVIHIGYDGTVTTLFGRTLDRTKLQLDANGTNLPGAGGYSDAQLGAVLAQVGTIGSPGFTQWYGLIDIDFDPTDTSGPGGCSQTCFVTNPTVCIVIKITGLFSGAAVATRYAGIENSSNTSSTGNGGPATSANIGNPLSAICNAAGDLYITDQLNGEIRIVDKATQHINHAFGNQTGKPSSQAVYLAAQTSTSNTYCGGAIGNTVSNASALINFPGYMRFASNGDIVVVEAPTNNFRRIGIGSGLTSFINYPYAYTNSGGPGITTVSSFLQFDIDQCQYPIDHRGASPIAGQGAFGPVDDIFFMTPPESDPRGTSARMSIDGTTYNTTFSGDSAPNFNINFQGTLGDDYGTALYEGQFGFGATFSDSGVGVYSWFIALSRTRAHMIFSGYRYSAMLAWRPALMSDPDTMLQPPDKNPESNVNIYSLGQAVWRYGSSQCFPLGMRQPFGTMYGATGFGALGSDVAPTVHDMAVIYNGGSADYTSSNITIPIATMVASGTSLAVTLTGGNNAFTSGVTGLNGQYVMISGATNTGSGGNSAVNGFFPVTTYTNSQNFTMTVPTPPGSGTITPGVLNYGDAVMQKFINNGGTGSVPRPEITGRDWQALSFFIRRSTTAGSYPGPVALPAPNPSTPYDQTAPPQISNVVATQLSHTSIRVTWTTDQSTIGLACAGTAALIGKQYTYSVYSPLESGYGTSHNVVITQVPDTIAGPSTGAIHFCVLSKNVEGTSSYSPDQTITITP